MYSRAEIIELINAIEKRYHIEDWRAYGICIWPIVRFSIYAKLWSKNNNQVLKKQTSRIFKYYTKIPNFLTNFISSDVCLTDVIFLNNSGCRREVDGIWIDVFTDPIRNVLSDKGYSSKVFEWENTSYKCPCYSDSTHFQSNLDLIKLKAKFNAIINKKNFPYFDEVNALVDYVLDLKELSYQIELIHELYYFFSKQIRVIKPKIAFSTIYYNEISMALFMACKEEGVITVDIQHGMQVGNNPAYSSWQHLPKEAYDLLPDIYLVRGKSEKDNLEKWLKRGKVVISGDMWLNFWKNGNESVVKKYDSIIRNWRKGKKKVVLYTLDYAPIPELIKKIIKKTSTDFFWCIRLHPADIANMEKRIVELEMIDGLYEIENSSNWPLHAWLRNVDIHITEYSGVVFEAEQLGVPSIVISEKEGVLFSDVIKRERAVVAVDEDEIVNALNTLKKWKYEKESDLSFVDALVQ